MILGHKADMSGFIAGILKVNPTLPRERLVIVSQVDESVVEELRLGFPGALFLRGDVVDPMVIQRANVARAARVLVLADESIARSDQEKDARTVMAVMTLKSLAPRGLHLRRGHRQQVRRTPETGQMRRGHPLPRVQPVPPGLGHGLRGNFQGAA